MPVIKIIKKKDDPICTRVSVGGNSEVGYYCVYRGSLDDARTCIWEVFKQLQEVDSELEISPDDGKEFA